MPKISKKTQKQIKKEHVIQNLSYSGEIKISASFLWNLIKHQNTLLDPSLKIVHTLFISG